MSACYTAGGELQRLTIESQAFNQVFTTILSNQEECSVLVQAFDALHTLADHGMECIVHGGTVGKILHSCAYTPYTIC